MITPFDREYKATKCIKQGKKTLKAPFDELARWVASTWKVTVLNVIYDARNSLHAPRIQVILEHRSDAAKFRNGMNFDHEKQIAIKTKFIEIISREETHKFDLDGLFVVFSAFVPLARWEADDQITDLQVKALKTRIGNPDLWEISRSFGSVTFFFYTDAQAKLHEKNGDGANMPSCTLNF
jgi:hypothetical protein